MSCPARIPCANEPDPSPCPGPHLAPAPEAAVLGRENAVGRHYPPKGPEAGGARVSAPRGRTPATRRPLVQSIDTAPRGEGAPSFSRARQPGRSGPRPSLAFDPAPGCSAARGPCTPEGGCGCWKERPVGGRIGRRGRRRSRSGAQVAGAEFPALGLQEGAAFPVTEGQGNSFSVSQRQDLDVLKGWGFPGRRDWLQPPYAGPSTQPTEPSMIPVPLLLIRPPDQVKGTED
ncbi:PREDICTED: uncharacterized protein LOC109379744 [Hipposideros armiger]|uniref:Uncharacterized protein LOC109379744 n=1 Tax=Hipposideros armiger TaxID=186990 RepID=A0A8B7QV45_HIPAR|nr:PREDICTED: uncharacterized protein LOC109379744 [Hipposideros armiger]